MNIFINAYSAKLGGGQTYLLNLLERLPVRSGLRVRVFAPPDLKLPVHANIVRESTSWPVSNPLLRAVWEKVALPVYLWREKADVLFCPGGIIASAVPAQCKSVTMFRNMIPFDEKVSARVPWGLQRMRNWILRRVMVSSLSNADLAIFISAYARGVIEDLSKIKNPVTVPHGLGESFRTYGRKIERPSIAPASNYLLYVSRFDVYKHHDEVITAFSLLPDSVRADYKLLLVGETDSPMAGSVKAKIDQLNLTDRVVLTGPIRYSDLPPLYHHASAILFASSCENCPNILLESLGAGRPVLSSNVMPMPEFGGPDLAYFSPYDPVDIAAALQRVLTDSEYSARLAEAAQLRSTFYDWSRTAEVTWNMLFSLAGDKRP